MFSRSLYVLCCLSGIDTFTDNGLKDKQFKKMNREIDNLEALMIEAEKTKGAKWVQEEALWCTWSLGKFGTFFKLLSGSQTKKASQ